MSVQAEILRGLACASQAHYADAAVHFADARQQLPVTPSPLLAALDAFIDSHARFWKAQQALHDASHHFVLTSNDQEARLADLQEAIAAAGDGVVEMPAPASVFHSPIRSAAVEPSEAHLVRFSDAPAPMRIVCFGRFSVELAGQPVSLTSNRKGQAILRYLAAQPHHRELVEPLAETFWPDDEPDVARHKLHVALSALRRSIGAGRYIQYRDGVYELDRTAPISFDVEEFEHAFASGQRASGRDRIMRFRDACTLYSGPFLAEDRYADWATIRREQLAQAFLHMCVTLAEDALESGGADEAVRWASAILEEDRCNEAAHRLLMRAYVATGQQTKALAQYQRCERVLAEEMGVAPTAETTDLFYAVLGRTPAE